MIPIQYCCLSNAHLGVYWLHTQLGTMYDMYMTCFYGCDADHLSHIKQLLANLNKYE